MDLTIHVDRMRLRAFHGLFPQERMAGNIFTVSLSVTFHVTEAQMESDVIDDTVSYAVLADIVRQQMEIPSNLLEHVALRIIRQIRALVPDSTGSVTISKLTPPIKYVMDSAGVTITW